MANEKRLIDANALMDEFRNYMVERHDRIKCASEENCKVCENGCLWREVVSKAPTVDAVEVVHGRWLTLEEYAEKIGAEPTGYMGGWRFCSECEQPMRELYGWAYCPNCGAKMDGDGNA